MTVDTQYTYEVFLLDLRHPDAPPKRISHGLSGIGGSLDWSPDGKDLLIFAGPVAAREIYRLEQEGLALRLFVIKRSHEALTHPVVDAIRSPRVHSTRPSAAGARSRIRMVMR